MNYHYRQPLPHATHVVTIPGTTFLCFIDEETYMKPYMRRVGRERKEMPPKVDALLKKLAKTTIPGPGKRRKRCEPVVTPIGEWRSC